MNEIQTSEIYGEIKNLLSERRTFRKMGNICETSSIVSGLLSTIIAYAAGIYNYRELSFVAGTLGVVALALRRFSVYSLKEFKERTSQVNVDLESMKLPPIASLPLDPSES